MSFPCHPAPPASKTSKVWTRLLSSAMVFLLIFPLLMAGCGKVDFFDRPHMISLSGNFHGGQQPVGATAIQIWSVGSAGDGSASTPLLTETVTTSDGSGDATNSNANASNGYNSYPAGDFTLPTAIACPSSTAQIYITGVGGNPGLGSGIVNPNLALMALLGQCGDFTAHSYVSVNELTTVGSVAPLNGFMNSYSAIGSGSGDAAIFLAALEEVFEYTNVTNGTVPGPMLPAGYYASSTEIQSLGDIIATCVNSSGGSAGDGSPCGMLFSLVAPAGVAPPTDTIGAMLDIIKYPTNNVCPIFDLLTATGPYQPTLTSCPPNWELPILPFASTPTISPVTGTYVGPQTVTLTDATPGVTIYYTTNGTAPSATSASTSQYTGPFVVNSSAKVEAIAAETGYETSAIATATYVITPASTPVSLAFIQEPSNTATGYTIAPPVSVAVEDANGNIVTNATNPVTIALGANPLGTGTLSGTLTAMPSNGIATFLNPSVDVIANGYTLVATSGTLTPATSTAFNITPYPLTITPSSNLVGVGSTLTGSFTLSQPAPAAGVTVNLASSSAAVSIAPASVTLTSGQTVGSFTYAGIATGSATLSAAAANYLTGTSTVVATNQLISLGQLPAVAPGQTSQLALSLGIAAPAPGVTVSLTSSGVGSSPACATVTPSVFIPTMFKIAAENPQVTAQTMGTALITATAPGYAPAVRTVSCSLTASFPASTTIPLSAANPVTLTISAPAPTGGLSFTLSSDNPNIASVPSSIIVPQGSTTVSVPVTGVAFGTTTIRANSPGVAEATTSVTVQATITMQGVTTGTNEYVPANVYLGATSSPPTAVTITSNNPAVAMLSASPSAAGSNSITFSNISNSVPTFYVQGQGTVGSTTLTVSAPGYLSGSGTVVVDPVGVVFYSGLNIATTTISPASPITLGTALLDPNTLAVIGFAGTPNPGTAPYSIAVNSTSTPSGVGTITTSPVTFSGAGTATTSFNPLAVGTATISLGAQPPGFFATSSAGAYLSGTATVTANSSNQNIGVSVPTTGVGLQVAGSFALQTTPSSPVNVTLTSTSNALLSLSPTAPGSASITVSDVSAASPQTFYVQGQTAGTGTLAVTASGYNQANSIVTVDPSGIVFANGNGSSGFSTTSSSTPTTLTLATAILDPHTLAVVCPNQQCGYALNPGVTLSIHVNNGTPSIGTLTGEGGGSYGTVAIGANGTGTTAFQPINVGTTTLTLGNQPAGLTATTSAGGYLSQIATVTGPAVNVGSPTTGAGLYVNGNATFATPPITPVTVTITVASPGIATVSKSPTLVGSQSITFTNVQGSIPAFYVQGQSVGTTTLNVFASGYSLGTGTITVNPAGIVFYEGNSNISTTTFSSPSVLTLATAILDPVTLAIQCTTCYYPLNPGTGPFSIAVTSSTSGVGIITDTPVTFPAGSNGLAQTAFEPVTAGTTTIALGAQPSGFTATSTSGGYLSGTATVTAPPLNVNVYVANVTTGVGLYTTGGVSLSATAPSPVTVTITSANPNVALLSTSATAVGTASITFTNIISSIPPFYVQGQAQGTSALTVNVSGYSTGSATITVDPSGVVFYGGSANSTFSTTTFSSPTAITLATAILDPVNLTVLDPGCSSYPFCYYPLNPGISLSIPVTSSQSTTVGSIVTSPVIFPLGSNGLATTSFQPIGVGTSTLALGTQPPGLTVSTSNGFVSGTATVTGPAITASAATTGVDLYVSNNASLGVAPPNPVAVTITVADPTIATLSEDTVTPGLKTIAFPAVAGTSPLTYYVQGQGVGTTYVTVSAPGYTNATATLTVDPSGIVFFDGPDSPTITTTSFSAPATLTLATAILDPKAFTVLCPICSYPINPGAGPFSIGVTSSVPAVGTITNGTVTFPAGSNGIATTAFQPATPGNTVVALGTQPAPFTATDSTPGYLNKAVTVTGPCNNVSNVLTGTGFYASGSASLQIAPPSGSVTMTLTSSNPAVALLSATSTVAGSSSISFANITGSVPTFYVQGQSVGTATITASAPGYCNATGTITVDPPSIVFQTSPALSATFSTTTFSAPTTVNLVTAILDPVTSAVVGTAYPLNPGNGPISMPVVSSTTTVGTLQSPVIFPAGSNGVASTTFQPVNVGNTTLELGAEPAGYSTTSSTTGGYLNGVATVTGPTISLSSPITGAGVYVSANASLAVTPPTPVTVTITSSNPAVALLSAGTGTVGSPSLTFTGITGSVPTFYVQGLTAGTATLTAVATGYTTANTTITVDPLGIVFQGGLTINTTTFSAPTQIAVSDALLDPVTLAVIASGLPFNPNYGPYTITLSSTVPAVGTVTPSVTFAQGSSGVVQATFTPVNAGNTTITLGSQPAGFMTTLSSGTYLNGPATVTAPTISAPNPTTGASQYVPVSASLPESPTGGVTVTISSSNSSVALLSTSATTSGTASGGTSTVTFTNVTSTSIPVFYVQGQSIGTATLTISATGYTAGTGTITVDPSGIVFYNGSNSSTLQTTTYAPASNLTLATAILNPGALTVLSYNAIPNPGTSLIIPIRLGTPSVGTVSTPVTFAAGANTAVTTFTPVAAGTSTITLGTQPTGFSATNSTPGYLSGTITVSAPNVTLSLPAASSLGANLSASGSLALQVTPPSPVNVTLTSANPSVALLSTSATTVGSASITFNSVSNTSSMTFYVQGQAAGTSAVSVTATGYNGGGTITVYPSAFGFSTSTPATFSTTSLSGDTTLTLTTLVLNPSTLAVLSSGEALNPGVGPISIPVTSANTAVGTILTSPVLFNAGSTTVQTAFTPVGAGTSVIALAEPAGFSTPATASYIQGTATVTSGAINVPASQTTGVSLTDGGLSFSLASTPPSGVNVTLTSSNPAVATVGYNAVATTVGTASIAFPLLASTAQQYFNIQGQSVGTSTISVSANGYTTASFTVTVDPSGFGFTAAPSITTSTLSGNTTLTLTTLVLNPSTLAVLSSGLPLNPGTGSISVPVTSSNSAVGTIVTSPVVFAAGSSTAQTAFQPVGPGSTTIAVGPEPAGFSTPSATANVQGSATVSSFGISVPTNQTVGISLTDGSLSVALGATPPGAVTITLTSSNPAVATLGVGPTGGTAGSATITFTGVTSTAAQSFNIQGLLQGTSTVTVSAPGYITATFTVTIIPTTTINAYHEADSLTFSVLNSAGTGTTTAPPSSVYREADGLTFSVLNSAGTGTVTAPPSSVYREADSLTFSVLNSAGTGTVTAPPSSVYREADGLTFSVLNSAGTGTVTAPPSSVYREADSLTFSVLNSAGTGTVTAPPSSVYREADGLTFSVQNTASGVAAVSEPRLPARSFANSLSPASVSSGLENPARALLPEPATRDRLPRTSVLVKAVNRLLHRHPPPRNRTPFEVQVAASPPDTRHRLATEAAHPKPG